MKLLETAHSELILFEKSFYRNSIASIRKSKVRPQVEEYLTRPTTSFLLYYCC